ncbi:unnamed protein product, partial [Didymodactylos carnosus]
MINKNNDERISQLITKCPITQLPIQQPVLAEDGFIYERYAILKWLKQHNGTSPMTRQSIKIKNLKTVIEFYHEDDGFDYNYLPIISKKCFLTISFAVLILV